MIKDENKVPQFLKMLEELSTTHLEIGIFGDTGLGASSYMDESGNTVELLIIATVHEFGTTIKLKNGGKIVIPERSYLRSTFDNEKSKIVDKCDKLLESVINLKLPVEVFFQTIGEYIVGLVQGTLTDLKDPGLSDPTIKAKGSSNPLIDTGRLRQSITYKVVRK